MSLGLVLIGTAFILFFFLFKGSASGTSKGTTIVSSSLSEMKKTIISKYALDENLVEAIIKVESDGNVQAINPDGPSYGLMQITPILAQDYGLIRDYKNVTLDDKAKMLDPSNNLNVGCWFLNYLLRKYPRDIAIQMYNVGETGYNNGSRVSYYLNKVIYWMEIYAS